MSVKDRFPLDEWQLHSVEPEALNVGQLNRAVRMLREELYQQALAKQDLLEALKYILPSIAVPKAYARAVAAIAKAEGR